MTDERKIELFNKAIEWIWEHTEGYGVDEFLNALQHIGYTKVEIMEEIAKNNFDDEHDEVDECPLGGDIANDCKGCAYADEYHFVNGECIERGCEADVCDRGGDARCDCKHCAAGEHRHCVDGKCCARNTDVVYPNLAEMPFGDMVIKEKVDAMYELAKDILPLIRDYGEYADEENEVLEGIVNFHSAYKDGFGKN